LHRVPISNHVRENTTEVSRDKRQASKESRPTYTRMNKPKHTRIHGGMQRAELHSGDGLTGPAHCACKNRPRSENQKTREGGAETVLQKHQHRNRNTHWSPKFRPEGQSSKWRNKGETAVHSHEAVVSRMLYTTWR